MTKKKTPPNKFLPGDVVVFTGPYLYNGEVHAYPEKFKMGVEYEVLDHSQWQDQRDDQEKPHVILTYKPRRIGSDSYQWVDEDCLELAQPLVTDEEVEAALKSIAAAAKD